MARRVALSVLLCIAVVCPVAAAADEPRAAGDGAADQWIAPLPDDLDLGGPFGEVWRKEQMSRWVVWPSDEYIAERQPPKDRSRPIPTGGPGAKGRPREVRPPAAALGNALVWVRVVLRGEWVPDDLRDRIVLLQEDDPAESSAVCRLERDGTEIQVNQHFWALCVVIRPAPELIEGLAPGEIGPALFRRFFVEGEKMAARSAQPLLGVGEGLTAFVGEPPGRWWALWYLWYTDGRSLAVFSPRNEELPQRDQLPGEPWF